MRCWKRCQRIQAGPRRAQAWASTTRCWSVSTFTANPTDVLYVTGISPGGSAALNRSPLPVQRPARRSRRNLWTEEQHADQTGRQAGEPVISLQHEPNRDDLWRPPTKSGASNAMRSMRPAEQINNVSMSPTGDARNEQPIPTPDSTNRGAENWRRPAKKQRAADGLRRRRSARIRLYTANRMAMRRQQRPLQPARPQNWW